MNLEYVVVRTSAPEYDTACFDDIDTFKDIEPAIELKDKLNSGADNDEFYTVEVRD